MLHAACRASRFAQRPITNVHVPRHVPLLTMMDTKNFSLAGWVAYVDGYLVLVVKMKDLPVRNRHASTRARHPPPPPPVIKVGKSQCFARAKPCVRAWLYLGRPNGIEWPGDLAAAPAALIVTAIVIVIVIGRMERRGRRHGLPVGPPHWNARYTTSSAQGPTTLPVIPGPFMHRRTPEKFKRPTPPTNRKNLVQSARS